MKSAKDIVLFVVMLAVAVLADLVVVLLLFVSGFVNLDSGWYGNFPLAIVFTILSLLVVNANMVLIPVLKNSAVAPTVYRATVVTGAYFVFQLVLTLTVPFLGHMWYLILSLGLLAFFILGAAAVFWVSSLAQGWGKGNGAKPGLAETWGRSKPDEENGQQQ